MNALQQYIDLYDTNRQAIDAHCPEPINTLRQQARDALNDNRLPGTADEGYEKTDVAAMFAPDYGVNINRMRIPVDIAATFRCDVPNISTLLGVVVNDKFVATDTLTKNCPQGLTVMSLSQAARQYPSLVERYYGKIAPLNDASTALNTMFVQDGVFIHADKGFSSDKAVQIVSIFSSPTPLLAMRRIVVALEEDAQLQVLMCDHTQDATQRFLSSQVVELYTAKGAKLDYYDLEETSPLTSRMSQLYASQSEGSSLLVNCSTLSSGTTRNEFNVSLDGPHCSTLLAGMVTASGKMHVDNSSSIVHAAESCHSDQLFKYVLDNESTGAFEGSITVTPNGRFTEAYQSNRNILAGDKARMHTKPQLLIFNDDVKCSHGATTGQLDQQALFYMRTRGIPYAEARTMLMQAFMADVIDTVRLDSLRDRLHHLVENRLAGRKASCQTCHSGCHIKIDSND